MKEGYAKNIELFMSEVDKEKYPNAEQKYRFGILESTCEK